MNLKLKKVVKNNVVDYGTPDLPSLSFEDKFKFFNIIKYYKKNIFKEKPKPLKHIKSINNFNTQRNLIAKNYYKKILLKNQKTNRLLKIGNNFRNKWNNKKIILRDINHVNDLFGVGKSQNLNLRIKNPFSDSGYNSQTLKSNIINDDNNRRYNLSIIKSISNIYEDNLKYKKINNFKDFAYKLKCKELLRRKNNLTTNQVNSSSNINNIILTKNKNENENELKKVSEYETQTVSDAFNENEFNGDKAVQKLKKHYNFFCKSYLDIDDINTEYFLILKKILKKNPGVKFRFDLKESEKKILKIKKSYNVKNINNSKNENENELKKVSEYETQTVSDVFHENEFNGDKTVQRIKRHNNFFRKSYLDTDNVNNEYFLILRKILKNNPGVKFRFDLKESEKKISKIKKSYNIKNIPKK